MICRVFRLLILLPLVLPFACLSQVKIWIATNGNDANEGSQAAPLATPAAALRKARELRRLNDASIANGANIILKGGTYQMYQPLFIRPEDAGTASSPTIFEPAPNEKTILSGGVQISGWKKTSKIVGLPTAAQPNVWVADVPQVNGNPLNFRQLWVNDLKAVRARYPNGEQMDRILSWDKKTQSCQISKPVIGNLQGIEGLEMVIHQWWAIANLRVKKVTANADSLQLTFQQPESKIQSEHPWPPPRISKETGNSAFYLTNAIQFLDSPGEWYLDRKSSKLYYWPLPGENLQTATVIVPVLETLVQIEGTIDNPVSYVSFKGISFQHTGWLRPSEKGHVPLQTGMYLLDAYKLKVPGTPDKNGLENQAWVGRPAAAVEVKYTNNTSFEGCCFKHIASTGLDYQKGTHNDSISGNLFTDIGGNGILVGTFSAEATEAHLPYDPKDEREVCSHETISNNLIDNVTNEDWGCVGIAAGFVKNSRMEHNEIRDVSYTGISLGWGWTKTVNAMRNNVIASNYIHRYAKHLYDVAGIYTLSAQPGSSITNNVIDSIYKAPYAHLPNHWFYLYTDEGSSYFNIKNNWCPSQKFLANANGPGNVWENNGPMVADSIHFKAGIEERYQQLLGSATPKKYIVKAPEPFNQKSILEIVLPSANDFDKEKLQQFIVTQKITEAGTYQWQNHIVVFGKMNGANKVKTQVHNTFSNAQVKFYDTAFYEFNKRWCNDTITARQWDNIILTANLVSDTAKQSEYLQYHATQYQQWPEVANGFCNADFQQLLVFRNGRQLMLVISIPTGESLDKLNPETTKNNPRVDDWNTIMKQYQEGIAGTKPGESWVFLQEVKRQE